MGITIFESPWAHGVIEFPSAIKYQIRGHFSFSRFDPRKGQYHIFLTEDYEFQVLVRLFVLLQPDNLHKMSCILGVIKGQISFCLFFGKKAIAMYY